MKTEITKIKGDWQEVVDDCSATKEQIAEAWNRRNNHV